MVIKEFILQGIRRFREPVRFQLNNGLNVFFGGNEKGKTTIADALFFLLSMVMDTEQNEGLRSDGAKEVRLGITFKDGPDNFRLLMDVISDAVLLSKYNQEAKKFDTVSKDRDEIREFFKRELLFKPLDRYKDLYLIDPYVIISPLTYKGIPEAPEEFTLADTSDISLGGTEDFEPTSFAGNEGIMEDTMTGEEIRSEIGKLEEELKHASETAEKQDKIEQLESELTEVHDKIKTINSLKTTLQDIEKQVNALNKFSDLPDDIETKIDEYLRFEGRIKKEMEDTERQRSQYESVSADVPPFYRDKTFIAGAGLVLLFIIAPVLLSIFVGSWGIYLSAGIFAGFATMGYSLWKDAGKRGEIKKRKESVAALEKQIKEQRNKYEIEGSVIKSIISSMKLDSPASLKEGIKRYKETLDEFAKAKSGYNTAVAGNDPDMLKNQEEKLKSDIDTAQEQIRALSVSGMDPYSITQQIESLKNRLNHIGSVQVRQKTEPVVPKKQPDVSRQPRQAPVPAFIGNITSSHFKSLTRGKYQEISIAANKIVPVTDSGREVEFNSLPGSVKEKGMFSIILSIIGLVAEKWPWPIVMDDPVMLLDDANRASVYSMVKNLSKETQVVFLTKDSNLKPFAYTFISL